MRFFIFVKAEIPNRIGISIINLVMKVDKNIQRNDDEKNERIRLANRDILKKKTISATIIVAGSL